MTRNFYKIFILLTLAFVDIHCSSGDGGSSSSANSINETFIGETGSEYIKMVSLKTKDGNVSSHAIIHHQLPMVDFKKGHSTALQMTESGGYSGIGPQVVGMEVSGGGILSDGYVSDTSFYIESTSRVRFTIKTWKNEEGYYAKKPLASVSGFLVRASSNEVLSYLTREIDKLNARNVGFTVATLGQDFYSNDIKEKLDENFCRSYFLNSCASLVKVGLFADNASSLTNPENQRPDSTGKNDVPRQLENPRGDIVPHKRNGGGNLVHIPPVTERPITIDPPNSFNEKPYPYIKIETDIDAKTIVDAATVQCEDKSNCSDSAGLLIGSDRTSVYQCSATHIGNGYFSTNSHCMPQNLVYASRSFTKKCAGSLWVKLPETNTAPAQTFECEELVMATMMDENKEPHESRDIMIFKVKGKVDRPAVSIDWTHGPAEGDRVTFWPADPDRSKPGIHGIMREKTCKVSDVREFDDILEYFNWNYPVSYLTNCTLDIIKGNSGSTATLGNRGKVLISHTHGVGTNSGMSSNYTCSQEILENGSMQERTLEGCRWINKDSQESMRNQMRFEKSRKEIEEVSGFLKALFEMQDRFFVTSPEKQKVILDRYFGKHFSDPLITEVQNLNAYINQFSTFTEHSNFVENTEPMVLQTSGGKEFTYLPNDLLQRTGFEISAVLLPQCLGPLTPETLKSHRNDYRWNPMSAVQYNPIVIRFPISKIQQVSWVNAPRVVKWNEFNNLRMDFEDSVSTQLGTVVEIQLSNFYDPQTKQLKNPTITLTEVEEGRGTKSLKNFPIHKKVMEKLQNLKFCE